MMNPLAVSAADMSVVICAYSTARWSQLAQAVASVVDQREGPKDLILVIDHNDELLVRASDAFPAAHVVANEEHRGLSGARNTGVQLATGHAVAFLDDDAVAAPEWLCRLAAGYDRGVAGVGGRVRPLWQDGPPRWFPDEFGWVVGCSYRGLPTGRAPVRNMIGANMSVRRSLFSEVGGFTTGIGRVGTVPVGCEETEWCIRVRQRFPELEFVYMPNAVVDHHVSEDRQRPRYLVSRSWHEGRSKASVAMSVGARDALAAETTYTRRVLPRGVARGLSAAVRGDVNGLGRAGAIIVGTGAAAGGYARERMRRWTSGRAA